MWFPGFELDHCIPCLSCLYELNHSVRVTMICCKRGQQGTVHRHAIMSTAHILTNMCYCYLSCSLYFQIYRQCYMSFAVLVSHKTHQSKQNKCKWSFSFQMKTCVSPKKFRCFRFYYLVPLHSLFIGSNEH